jgi:4-deoxy-L-threo-5-hexosulose-uronate ketol-isomerase
MMLNTPSIREYRGLDTAGLRNAFLLPPLFVPGRAELVCTDLDRAVVGGIVPLTEPLALPCPAVLVTTHLLERRELGIINLGGPGSVRTAGANYRLEREHALYLGRGETDVVFASDDVANPANFYLVSYPAHATYPSKIITPADANVLELGSVATCNRRRICQYIHEKGVQSCQLVMGFTRLYEGSCWNTMPPHTHMRRSEVYLYFDVPAGQQVVHLMGEPQETRLLWMSEKQAVLSPPWSIHSGAGTQAYAFVWAMGGDNKTFTDMDAAPVHTLR